MEIRRVDPYRIAVLSDRSEISAHAILIAPGMLVRDLVGSGVYYGAALSEAAIYRGKHVYVVGGANSAGQGAMFFSRYAKQVTVVVRGAGLKASMSRYLIDRIKDAKNVEVLYNVAVASVRGQAEAARFEAKLEQHSGNLPRSVVELAKDWRTDLR